MQSRSQFSDDPVMDGEQYSDTSGGSAGAARYTHGHGAAVLSAHSRRGAEDSAAYLLPHLNAGMDLLDVGCGPATITADLAGRVAPGRVVGLDTASGALEAARATLAERDLPARVELTDGDVMSLPFDDGTFDVAHAHQVLQHLSDPVGALAEMRRVTRPGGIVAVRDAVYSAMAWYPEPEGMKLWRSVYMATARANGGEPDAGGRLLAWARRAGFAEVTASALHLVLRHCGRPRLAVGDLGAAVPDLLRAPGRRPGAGAQRRPGDDGPGLAAVGWQPGRLVRRRARRGHCPCLTADARDRPAP